MRRPLLALLALAAGLALAAPDGDAVSVEPRPALAFASNRTGGWEAYVADPSTGATGRVTSGGAEGQAWSPDGRALAFERDGSVFVVKGDGTGERRIGRGWAPAWSPDGARLALVRAGEIVVVDLAGATERRLTRATDAIGTWAGRPAWSPDGRSLAYATLNGFFVAAVADERVQQLSSRGTMGYARPPSWAPDGTSVALVTSTCCAAGSVDGGYTIRMLADVLEVVRVADGRLVRLAMNVEDGISWSPDGLRIAFAQRWGEAFDAPADIELAPAGGGGVSRLTHTAVGESSSSPAWSPDGERIAFVRSRFPQRLWASESDVWVMRSDGSGARAVTTAFPAGGSNELVGWTSSASAFAMSASPPLVGVARTVRTSSGTVGLVAASGWRAAVLASFSDGPAIWDAPNGKLRRTGSSSDTDCSDVYALGAGDRHVAWLCASMSGVVDPHTFVSVSVTDRATGRSAAVEGAGVWREGAYPDTATGPRIAGEGGTIVFNKDARGDVLYRIDAGASAPRLRLLARNLAVEAVDAGRILGWRNGTAAVLRGNGTLIRAVPLQRRETDGADLAGDRVVALRGGALRVLRLSTGDERSFALTDHGGELRLLGAGRDLAVYASGVAVHVVSLTTGRDVVLALPNQGGSIAGDVTDAGLVYAYNAPWVWQPGRVGFVAYAALARIVAA